MMDVYIPIEMITNFTPPPPTTNIVYVSVDHLITPPRS